MNTTTTITTTTATAAASTTTITTATMYDNEMSKTWDTIMKNHVVAADNDNDNVNTADLWDPMRQVWC